MNLRLPRVVFLVSVLSACSTIGPKSGDRLQEDSQNQLDQTNEEAKANPEQVVTNSTIAGRVRPSNSRFSCFNISKAEPHALSGTLEWVMFPGPPNYEDVQQGDAPEPTYILKLDAPICISDTERYWDSRTKFDTVHLVAGKISWEDLRGKIGKRVTVRLYNHISRTSGHHRAPLVAWVSNISVIRPTSQSVVSENNPEADYGTAAMAIRGFYAALADGQGDVASKMVVSEKTGSGPFAAENLSRFYGGLRKPIELLSISKMGIDTYMVSYTFVADRTACNGRAIVETTERHGRNFIARIRALNGC